MASWYDRLKTEPYDPDAFDGDKDGIVQDGTPWERPAGVRLYDSSGKEIQRGLVSERPIDGLFYRDSNGQTVEYTPSFLKPKAARNAKPGEQLGRSLNEQRDPIGEGTTLGDRRRREAEKKEREKQEEENRKKQEQAAAQLRKQQEQFAAMVRKLPSKRLNSNKPESEQPDAAKQIFASTDREANERELQKADGIFRFLGAALQYRADIYDARLNNPSLSDEEFESRIMPEIRQKYPQFGGIDEEELVTRLNRAAEIYTGMSIEGPLTRENARINASYVEALRNTFRELIDEQSKALSEALYAQDRIFDGDVRKLNEDRIVAILASLQPYSSSADVLSTSEDKAAKSTVKQAALKSQIESQILDFLFHDNYEDLIQSAYIDTRETLWSKRNPVRRSWKLKAQGLLSLLYPNGKVQEKNKKLGKTSENNINPYNPLPTPTDNDLKIKVSRDLQESNEDPELQEMLVVQAAVEHLMDGGSLEDIPQRYWAKVLDYGSSMAENDLDSVFYAVKPNEGAVAATTLYWVRNKDGTPGNQGYVVKGQPWSMAVAEHAGWLVGAALGIYPESSNWGGKTDTLPSMDPDWNDWLDYMPALILPIAFNHLPTSDNLDNLETNRDHLRNYEPTLPAGTPHKHLAAILHTFLIGDTDRNPGNTIHATVDGEGYVFPIDFGGSGGFVDRDPLGEYIRFNYRDWAKEVERYRQGLTAERAEELDETLVATYDAVLQRMQMMLRNTSEDEFVALVQPKNKDFYDEYPDEMIDREARAYYDGLRRSTEALANERAENIRLITGKSIGEITGEGADQNELVDEIQEIDINDLDVQPYTRDRLKDSPFNPRQNPPDGLAASEKFVELYDTSVEDLLDAFDVIDVDLLDIGFPVENDLFKQAVSEGDRRALAELLIAALGTAWNQNTSSKTSVVLASILRGELRKRGIKLSPEFKQLAPDAVTGERLDADQVIANHLLNDPANRRAREVVAQAMLAQYETTQDYLKENGISEVRAYRGLFIKNSDVTPFDPTVESALVATNQRTISSWAINLDVASQFAQPKIEVEGVAPDTDGYGVILHSIIPAEEVFAIATNKGYGPRKKTETPRRTGFGVDYPSFGESSEDEIIAIGANRFSDYVIQEVDSEIDEFELDRLLLDMPDRKNTSSNEPDSRPQIIGSTFDEEDNLPNPDNTPEYTPERLQSTLLTGEEGTGPTAANTAKSLIESSDAEPEEILRAIDTLESLGYSYLVGSVKDRDEILRDIANGDREEGFKVLVSHFYDSWTTSNTEPNSLLLSQIAREELEKMGIEFGPEYTKYWGGDIYDVLDNHPVNQPRNQRTREIIAEIVKAHYEGIQKYFKDNGITELRVFRGMSFQQDDENPFDSLPITGEIELEQRNLSSWAYDFNEANSFARLSNRSTTGVLLHDIVPVEQVFSITTKDQGPLGESTLGSVGEREVVLVGAPRRSRYFVKKRDDQGGVNQTPQASPAFETLDQIDEVLLNSNGTDSGEINFQPPQSPQPLQTRTAQQLKDADYRQKKGAEATSPSINDIAYLAAEDADFTAQEAFDALETLSQVSRIEFIPPYNASQAKNFAKEGNLAQIYVSVLSNISQKWNAEVTSPISRFFTQLVKEELSESFGIEFGPDYNVWFDEPGAKPNFDAPETEQGRRVIKKLINAQYKATQEHLAVEGITEVRSYRGIIAPSGPGTDFPDTNGTNQVRMRPISSWTHDYRIVGNFLYGQRSIILHAVFPAENIFSIRPAVSSDLSGSSIYMGIGDPFESEIVPLHTNMPYDYITTTGIDISKTDLDEILTGEKEWDPNNFTPTFDRQSRTTEAMDSQRMAEYESEAKRGDIVLNLDDAKFYTWDGQKWLDGQEELQPEEKQVTPEQPSLGNYTQDQLDNANYETLPSQVFPPSLKSIADVAADKSDLTVEETVEALEELFTDKDMLEMWEQRGGDRSDLPYASLIERIKNSENLAEAYSHVLKRLADDWNDSVSSETSMFLKDMVVQELSESFGIEFGPTYSGGATDGTKAKQKRLNSAYTPEAEKGRQIIRQLINAHYSEVQKYLADEGIEEVRIYRGIRAKAGENTAFPERAASTPLEMSPLSSWTTDYAIAAEFAAGTRGDQESVLVHQLVPAKYIFAIRPPFSKSTISNMREVEGFGTNAENEVIPIHSNLPYDYIVTKGEPLPQNDIDEILTGEKEWRTDTLQATPEQPSLGNYTQENLDNADYAARPVNVVPPTIRSVAEQAAENTNLSVNETVQALQPLDLLYMTDEFTPFDVQEALDNNDIARVYEIVLDRIAANWNGQVTDPFPEFFKDMVVEELQESFGIEFGPDYARGDLTPGQRRLPSAYTPESEQGRRIVKQLINAHYAAVQQYLADQGIEEVRIFRGIVTNTGEGTAFTEDASSAVLQMRPLSSWTTDYEIAQRFSTGGGSFADGVILHQRVPAKNIFAIRPSDEKLTSENRKDAQGFGTNYESEVLPLHSSNPYDYIITADRQIPRETVDQILKGETQWQRPPKREIEPIGPASPSDYLQLSNQDLADMDPASIQTGMVIYNTDRNEYTIWNGAAWIPMPDEEEIVG